LLNCLILEFSNVGYFSFSAKTVIFVYSPFAYMDPLSTNLTHMFCQLFQDALTEYTYAAELAGVGYNIHNTIYGLVVSQLFYINSIISVFVIMVWTCWIIWNYWPSLHL